MTPDEEHDVARCGKKREKVDITCLL